VKTPILSCAIILTLSLGALNAVYADSATWNLNPVTDKWELDANWSPETVPHGAADVATFGVSTVTTVFLPVDFPNPWEISGLIFSPGASAYTVMTDHEEGHNPWGTSLVVSGIGFVNDSGVTQNVVTQRGPDPAFNGLIIISNSASAGTDMIYTNNGDLSFRDSSSAGDATYFTGPNGNDFGDGPIILFEDNATAANGTFTNQGADQAGFWGGWLLFYDQSTAGTATVTNEGGTIPSASGGSTTFVDDASAADATISCNGGTTAGASGGVVAFLFDNATAAKATLIANGGINGGGGGSIQFYFGALGGLARAELFGNGNLDISECFGPGVTIGSIEGDGLVFLGQWVLTVGANNTDTKFSGVIADGGIFGGNGGSLTKIGTGILTLSSENTYTGGTTIEDGKVVIANQSGSATGTGPVSVTRGKLGGSGIIAGATTIGTGSGSGAFPSPAAGTTVRAMLTIHRALTFNADATYTCTFKANPNRARTDTVIADGVTIDGGAMIELVGHTRGTLTSGLVLTLIGNTSADPISGTFSNLPDGSIVTINGNNFQASYSGGDGNDLTLSVVP